MPAQPKSAPVRLALFKLAFFRLALLKLHSGRLVASSLTWFCCIEVGIYLATVYINIRAIDLS